MKKLILFLSCMCAFPQAQTPFTVYQSSGSSTGAVWLQERRTNGVNFLKLEAPQSIVSDFSLILPSALPAVNGECVTGTTAGVLSFGACAGAGSSFSHNGNSFGAAAFLGTNDNYALAIETNSVQRWTFDATGHLYAASDNNYDIGAGASNRPRSIYAATSVVAPLYGTMTSSAIGFQTDSATRWNVTASGMFVPFIHDTYDIGLTGTRVRGLYAGFGEFWKAGGTASSDYVDTRKVKIRSDDGASAAWDFQTFVPNSGASSNIYVRDNSGSRWLKGWRIELSGAVNFTEVYSDWLPAKRATVDGDAVNDSSFPSLGRSGSRWLKLWALDIDASGGLEVTGGTLLTGNAVLSGASNTMSGTIAPGFDGLGSIGTASYKYGAMHTVALTATGTTTLTATGATAGKVWTSTNTTGLGSWQSTAATAYDIRDYGGLCDGVADDTAAFTAAFSAIAGNFGRITIPSGRCMVTQIVPNNSYIGISGQGKWSSSIESISTSGESIIKMTPFSKFYYLEFSSFALRGKGDINSLAQVGIEVTGTYGMNDSSIHDMEFRTLGKGIYDRNTGVTGSSHIQIHNNQFSMGFYPTLPTVTAASNANPVSFTSTAHGQTGSISISIGGATGSWTSVNGTFTGTVTSANTFTIPVDSTGFGALTGSLVVTLLVHNPGIGIERDNEEGSGWQITDNDFGGLAEISGATSGNRAIYFHRFVGDLMIVGNHIEGGWIGIDLSCDNGTFATGACSYGQNVLAVGNKIDGIPYEYRLYNISSSDFTGNRGRGIDRSYITSGGGGSSTQNQYTPNAVAASGNSAAGLEMSGVGGNLALNTYDSGRIRIGDTATNLSALTNGISVFDASASSGIAFGQSDTRKVLLAWTYNATAGSALATLSTSGQANPIQYGAEYHLFQTGSVSRWAIDATGKFQPQANNAYPIGDSSLRASNVFSVLGNYSGLLTASAGLTVTGGDTTVEEIRFGTGSTYNIGTTGARARRVFTQGITTGGPSYWESGSEFIMRSGSIMTLEFGTPGAGKVLTSDAAGVATWQAGSTLPVADTTSIVRGSVDPSKLLAFEVDGFSVGTTRTLTPQNANYTIAGTDISQTFGATQTFRNIAFETGTTYNVGTSTVYALNIWASYVEPKTQLVMGSGVDVSGDLTPATTSFYKLGNSSLKWSAVYTDNLYVYNSIQAPSGNLGYTGTVTVRDAAGTGTCTNIFSGGLRTGGTC